MGMSHPSATWPQGNHLDEPVILSSACTSRFVQICSVLTDIPSILKARVRATVLETDELEVFGPCGFKRLVSQEVKLSRVDVSSWSQHLFVFQALRTYPSGSMYRVISLGRSLSLWTLIPVLRASVCLVELCRQKRAYPAEQQSPQSAGCVEQDVSDERDTTSRPVKMTRVKRAAAFEERRLCTTQRVILAAAGAGPGQFSSRFFRDCCSYL